LCLSNFLICRRNLGPLVRSRGNGQRGSKLLKNLNFLTAIVCVLYQVFVLQANNNKHFWHCP